jgi:hypothetical protein
MGLDKRITDLTDCLGNLPVTLDGKILLYTYVASDGIGDLILQIRTYHELNRLFPGAVECVTCCEDKHLHVFTKMHTHLMKWMEPLLC